MSEHEQREAIRRRYRAWRALAGLTQGQVEDAAKLHYPEFASGGYWRIENGHDFPSPSERRAIALVLRVDESDLPACLAEAKAVA